MLKFASDISGLLAAAAKLVDEARSGKAGSDVGTFHYHWWTWHRNDFDTTCHFRYLSKKQSPK